MTLSLPGLFDTEAAIAWLEQRHHRVIRPFVPPTSYSDAPSPPLLLKVALVDVETTGTDVMRDEILELGVVIAEYCPHTGQAYRVLNTYSALASPSIPIPAASTKIHGITDAMVQGKRFHDAEIEALFKEVSIVIAHNAAFDRCFLEARFPFFREKAWACSFAQIPWKEEGFGSASLEYLLYRTGFHFHGHRAVIDCQALLTVLQSTLPNTGIKALKQLLDTAQTPDLKIWALRTPFHSKDLLKKRQYRWHAEQKTWYKPITCQDLAQEIAWLRHDVYDHHPFQLKQETLDAYTRFSLRDGVHEIVNY